VLRVVADGLVVDGLERQLAGEAAAAEFGLGHRKQRVGLADQGAKGGLANLVFGRAQAVGDGVAIALRRAASGLAIAPVFAAAQLRPGKDLGARPVDFIGKSPGGCLAVLGRGCLPPHRRGCRAGRGGAGLSCPKGSPDYAASQLRRVKQATVFVSETGGGCSAPFEELVTQARCAGGAKRPSLGYLYTHGQH
jgi:hypothetical protein